MMAKFNQSSGNDSRAKLFEKNYLEEIKKIPVDEVENAESQYSDYGTAIYLDKMVLPQLENGSLSHRVHSWTNQHFTNLYVADLGRNDSGTVNKFDKM
jgi:hypothetical protein